MHPLEPFCLPSFPPAATPSGSANPTGPRRSQILGNRAFLRARLGHRIKLSLSAGLRANAAAARAASFG